MTSRATSSSAPPSASFVNSTATTEIYTLSLHDALPIYVDGQVRVWSNGEAVVTGDKRELTARSEEHTSELQSQSNLVCRLLLEKKNPRLRPLVRPGWRPRGQDR